MTIPTEDMLDAARWMVAGTLNAIMCSEAVDEKDKNKVLSFLQITPKDYEEIEEICTDLHKKAWNILFGETL